MEQNTDAMELLDLVIRPAFCVKDGIIIQVNEAAQRRMISPGTEISALLITGKQEYPEFNGGCLYLTLSLSGQTCGASVLRQKDADIFLLDQETEQAELQAMALAAQELRGPLASVMTLSDWLFSAGSGNSDPTSKEQIAQINRSLFQMLRIVSNMSDAARYAASTDSGQEVRNICAIFEEIFAKASDLLTKVNIRLHYSGLPEPILCLADEDLLERAVYNILSNAVKFTPKDSTIEVRLTRQGNKLYLTVQDGGSGIPDQLWGSVYSRYRREPAIEDGRFGIGLGLVLVRSAAALHGGTVLMEQPENGGVRITMSMEIRQRQVGIFRSPIFKVDYAGERDHGLIELSDVLPSALYEKEKIN